VATRKQKARRAKGKRHDYEVVYLDGEGNEVEPDEADLPSKAASSRNAKTPARATTSAKRSTSTPSKSRLIREPKPPSWSRAIRRGAIFMPILIVVVLLTNRNQSPLAIAPVAILFTALVIPFGYFTDHLAWRAFEKRRGRKPVGKSTKR
jgi:hypothetical protein